MSVAAGTQFTAYLADPGGDTVGVGARIEVPVTRQIITAWVAGTLSDTGMWSAVLDAPQQAGEFLIVWMTGGATQPDPFPIFVPVTATMGPVAPTVGGEPDYPLVQPSDVYPTLEEVAILERTRTRGDDGVYYDTFNSQTWPTDNDVGTMIDTAVNLILSQLREDFNPSFYEQVKDMVTLQTAILIESSFFRNQVAAETMNSWRIMLMSGMEGIKHSIEVDRAQAVVFAGMEPRQPDWDTDPWLWAM